VEEENADISKKEEEEEEVIALLGKLYTTRPALCVHIRKRKRGREKKSLSVPRVSRAKEIPLLTISALQRPPATRRAQLI
jgi:hypothetical protein